MVALRKEYRGRWRLKMYMKSAAVYIAMNATFFSCTKPIELESLSIAIHYNLPPSLVVHDLRGPSPLLVDQKETAEKREGKAPMEPRRWDHANIDKDHDRTAPASVLGTCWDESPIASSR